MYGQHVFPQGFVFGGATAAYQVEGATHAYGKGLVAWDEHLAQQGRFSADPASDFYNRYEEDLELCERFGINGLRISIAWTRIFPTGIGEVNKEGVEFYHRLFQACRAHHVEPYVTLHHFDSPLEMYRAGDFLNRDVIDAFEAYARFCFEEYKDEVTYWFTFNEIATNALCRFIEGSWPMGEKYRIDKALQCEHNMMVAHARAVIAYKQGGYAGEIGIVHCLHIKYPYDPNSREDIIAASRDDVIKNRLLLDATFRGSYAADTREIMDYLAGLSGGKLDIRAEDIELLTKAADLNDCMGVNYYRSQFVRAYDGENDIHSNSTGDKGSSRYALKGVGEYRMREGLKTTDWDWIIYPEGLYDLLIHIKLAYPNYKKLYITENGMGYKDTFENGIIDDEPRIDYIRQHLDWTLRAVEGGVNVMGYFVWSLQDQFSWTNGYNKRYGLFYVDFETQERYPKASAYWFEQLSRTGHLL